MEYVTSTLSSEDSWTDKISPSSQGDLQHMGYLIAAVKGTWSGTITVVAVIGGVEFDIDILKANVVNNLFIPVHTTEVYAGFKTGDYDSGSANIYIFKPGT